jgi:RNA-binding protein 25
MKPWVTKKIFEFLGEEEKVLIEFIMGKIAAHTAPAEILQQLTLVLDEEADIFVVKMWRMLVYEMYTASAK